MTAFKKGSSYLRRTSVVYRSGLGPEEPASLALLALVKHVSSLNGLIIISTNIHFSLCLPPQILFTFLFPSYCKPDATQSFLHATSKVTIALEAPSLCIASTCKLKEKRQNTSKGHTHQGHKHLLRKAVARKRNVAIRSLRISYISVVAVSKFISFYIPSCWKMGRNVICCCKVRQIPDPWQWISLKPLLRLDSQAFPLIPCSKQP